MFVLDSNGVKGVCVVTKETNNTFEIKNIAVLPDFQGNGFGKKLVEHVMSYYSDCEIITVGTGDVPSTVDFYKKCGFQESHRVKNFFIDNYDHPIFEDGKRLVDMVYLKKRNK
ncbi:MAG: GNAT family N-acetyltransferase [Lachnospirales bacterium]